MLKRIEIYDITINPKKLTEKCRLFIDPLDKQYTASIDFTDVDDEFINALMITLKSKLPIKILEIQENQMFYRAQFASASRAENDIETYGHDLAIENSIKFLPISQELELGTSFTLTASNMVEKKIETRCAKSILSESLTTSVKQESPMFNKRFLLLTLLPNERILFEAKVVVAKKDLSISRCMVARPKRYSIKIFTWLDTNPLILLKEAAEIMLKDDSKNELLKKIVKLKLIDYPIKKIK